MENNKIPEYEEFLEALITEISNLEESMNVLYGRTQKIKAYNLVDDSPKNPVKEEPPIDYLSKFYAHLRRIATVNNALTQINSQLMRTIG